MQVHAHPDDEASKGAGTAALYASQGVKTILVTCTGGEAGDILNPESDMPQIREDLPSVRLRELDESAKILGYASVHLLGYRDSGMAGSEENSHPESFWSAPMEQATERLVRIIREERPHVLITYAEDQSRYPHPDHIRAHDVTHAAFDAAGDASRFPDAGEPWQPLKLYWCGFLLRQLRAFDDAMKAAGRESPFAEWVTGRKDHHETFTTRIDVGDFLGHRRDALAAHRTQVAPDSHWFALSVEEIRRIWPWEEFVLARSLVGMPPDEWVERDLFERIEAVEAGERVR